MNQEQRQIVDCLREENRVLSAQILTRRLRLDDNQRRRLLGDTESEVVGPKAGGGCGAGCTLFLQPPSARRAPSIRAREYLYFDEPKLPAEFGCGGHSGLGLPPISLVLMTGVLAALRLVI